MDVETVTGSGGVETHASDDLLEIFLSVDRSVGFALAADFEERGTDTGQLAAPDDLGEVGDEEGDQLGGDVGAARVLIGRYDELFEQQTGQVVWHIWVQTGDVHQVANSGLRLRMYE